MKKLPGWWTSALVLLLVIWGGLLFYYHTGSQGVSFGGVGGGATINFHRGSDCLLYRINDDLALQVNANGTFAIVKYTSAFAPFALLCGRYTDDGTAFDAAHLSGDWLYGVPIRDYRDKDVSTTTTGVAAVNLTTGETISATYDEPANAGDPLKFLRPELTARGLTGDKPSLSLAVTSRLTQISTCNEGCENFNAAFLLLGSVWLIVLPIGLFFFRRRARVHV